MSTSTTATKSTPKSQELLPEITDLIHDRVRDWFQARKEYLNMSLIAREIGMDASYCRKTLAGETTPAGTPYRLPDAAVRGLYAISIKMAEPIAIRRRK